MALTRAQLLAGNQSNGVVLSGQPQGVIAGPGISISNTGIISVDSSSVTGLVKLNDPFAYNSYVWPGADGAAGEFLQTDGTGNLSWATPQGFAVVTVQPSPAPSPADIGELWFDCSTGTLNVYQNCVGTPSPNWFNVAQPGFPVDPGQTGAVPNFTGGNGTQATPYLMSVTSTGVGTTVAIINTVTVNGLAPFQYVPIVDLNAVTNGGRFSFTNYYANSSGQLIFNTVFSDLPTSGPGQNYIAAIRVGYATAYIRASVTITPPLTLSQGTITGTPTVGTPVSYTPGVAAGGTPGYTYAYQWKRNGTNINLATSSTYTPVSADVGQTLSVVQTVTDSLGASVSNTTTASAQTATAPFPNATWGPTPANGMDTNPGGVSGIYSGTGTTITVSGCIESAVYTPPAVPSFNNSPKSITSGQTLAIRWTATALCGNANTNTTMNGTVSDGTYTNSYTLQINRVPAAIGDITDTNVALGATVSKGINPAISGLNSVAYVTAGSGSTGLNIGVSLTAGGPFTAIPSAPSTTFPITNGQTLYVEQTVGGAVNTAPGYTAVVKVGDADGVLADEFTYFAQTVSSAVFPGVTFSPAGGPNAANETVLNVAGGGMLGTLNGVADSNAWPAGLGTTLSSPVSGANPTMKFRVNGGGAYVTSGLSVAPTNILNLAWNEAYLATVADGGTATGSITGTVGATTYTNTFTMSVKRDAVWSIGTPVTGAALNSSQSTSILLPDDYNVPVTVTFNNPTSGTSPLPMITGTISYAIDSNPAVLVTLGTTTATLNPGETLQVFGDVGGAPSQDYGIKIQIGTSAAQDWLVTTTGVTPTVKTPIIGPPGNNATGVGTSAGITISGDTYTPLNGAGTHASSNWELYKGSYPLQSANTISGVINNPAGTSWTATSGTASNYVLGVKYLNGAFWSVVNSSVVSKSTNGGVTWTDYSTPVQFASIAYGNGVYVGASETGPMYTSVNGSTWAGPYASGDNQNTDIGFDGTNFVAVSISGTNSNNVRYSPDGVTWSSVTPGGGYVGARSVTCAGGLTVLPSGTTTGGRIATTSDGGGTWSVASLGPKAFSSVAYSGSSWIAVGGQLTTDRQVAVSPDGIAWSIQGNDLPSRPNCVAWNGSVWVVAAGQNKFYTKPDDATTSWTAGAALTSGTTATSTANSNNGSFAAGAGILLSWGTWSTAPFDRYFSQTLATTTLTIANAAADGFLVGDTVVSGSGAAAGPATILSLDNSQVTVTSSTGWVGNNTQTLARATSMYTQVVPPPANPNTGNLESITVGKPPLLANTTYYVRVQYTSSLAITSDWSDWSKFTTGSLLPQGNATYLATGNAAIARVGEFNGVYYQTLTPATGWTSNPVRKSSDLTSWTSVTGPWNALPALSDGQRYAVNSLWVSPVAVVAAVTALNSGDTARGYYLYYTTDNVAWNLITSRSSSQTARATFITHASDPLKATVLFTTSGGGGSTNWLTSTTDGGLNWGPDVSKSDNTYSNFYAATANGYQFGGVGLRSTDNFNTVIQTMASGGFSSALNYPAVINNRVLYGGQDGLQVGYSDNAASATAAASVTWTQSTFPTNLRGSITLANIGAQSVATARGVNTGSLYVGFTFDGVSWTDITNTLNDNTRFNAGYVTELPDGTLILPVYSGSDTDFYVIS